MRGSLGGNVAASVLNAAAAIGTALVAVPLILHAVGLAGYGVWTLAQTVVIYVTTADAGIGPAVQRFSAVAQGGRRESALVRLLWTALGGYTVLGALAGGACLLLAPTLASIFDIAGRLEHDAETLFRLAGAMILASLVASALGNMQQGLERFGAYAVATALGSAAFLAALVALLTPHGSLPELAYAVLIQQATVIAVRLWNLRGLVLAGPPSLVTRAEARELVAFSARLQMNVVGTLVNNQTDKVVVGLIARPSTVGQLGIAAQVAEAGRLVGGAALSPMMSRMANVHGRGDPPALHALYTRLSRLWMLTVAGATVIGAASLYPLITGWLGRGHGPAAVFGIFLVGAAGTNLLTGIGTGYLRAVGRPGLEARYGAFVIALNVALTIALGLTVGPIGVVAATLVAYAIATTWFFVRLHTVVATFPPDWVGPLLRVGALSLIAAAAAFGWGVAVVEVLPTGASLLPVAAGVSAAFVAYMWGVTGVRPTVSNARALFAG